MDAAPALEGLTGAHLQAIATLWKRERREFVSSFSGTSMLPALAPGQPVVVNCGVEPAIGDVVVFVFREQIGVHRVVARMPGGLLTWGDANPLPDDPIETGRVIGVIRSVPAARRSSRRMLLLRMLGVPSAPIDVLARRIRFLYRLRAVFARGPRHLVRKAFLVALHRKPHC